MLEKHAVELVKENGKIVGMNENINYIDYREIRIDHWRTFKDNLPLGWQMTELLKWILSTMTYARDGQYAYPSGIIFSELGLSRAKAYRELDKLSKLKLIRKVNGYRKIQVNPFYFGKGTLKEIVNLRLSLKNGDSEPTETKAEIISETDAEDGIPY